jgi:hypothetical protein
MNEANKNIIRTIVSILILGFVAGGMIITILDMQTEDELLKIQVCLDNNGSYISNGYGICVIDKEIYVYNKLDNKLFHDGVELIK